MGFDNRSILSIDGLPHDYFCPVCRALVYPNEAFQTRCAHLYCKACLDFVVATTKACPYDGCLVTETDVKPLKESNKSLAESVGNVTVRCLYHAIGCLWHGTLSAFIPHGETCAYGGSPVLCNHCGAQTVQRKLPEHAQLCPVTRQAYGSQAHPSASTQAVTRDLSLASATAVASAAATGGAIAVTTAITAAVPPYFAAATAGAPQITTAEPWYQDQPPPPQLQYSQYYHQESPGFNPRMQQYQPYYWSGSQPQQPTPPPAPNQVNQLQFSPFQKQQHAYQYTPFQNLQPQMQLNSDSHLRPLQVQQHSHPRAQGHAQQQPQPQQLQYSRYYQQESPGYNPCMQQYQSYSWSESQPQQPVPQIPQLPLQSHVPIPLSGPQVQPVTCPPPPAPNQVDQQQFSPFQKQQHAYRAASVQSLQPQMQLNFHSQLQPLQVQQHSYPRAQGSSGHKVRTPAARPMSHPVLPRQFRHESVGPVNNLQAVNPHPAKRQKSNSYDQVVHGGKEHKALYVSSNREKSPERQKILPSSSNIPENRRPYPQWRSAEDGGVENMMLYWCQLYDRAVDSIKESEQGDEVDVKHLRKAYDNFLSKFPFCVKYWIRYAQFEQRFSYMDEVFRVYERAVLAVPHSVDMWCSYCQFAISAYADPNSIRRLFERALKFVGGSYFCATLYDLYLEFEDSQKGWQNMASIYSRLLQKPIEDLDWYFNCFGHFIAVHGLDGVFITEEACEMKSTGLENQQNEDAASAEVKNLQFALSIWQETYGQTKEIEATTQREKVAAVPLLPYQPHSGHNMVTLPLPEFLMLKFHIKEIIFHIGIIGSKGVATPIGTRLLRALYRCVTEQHLAGFCWAGGLQPEDILVTFDGTAVSELVCHIIKPALIHIKEVADLVADHACLKSMLNAPFCLKGLAVPYLKDFFDYVMTPPDHHVVTDARLRGEWIEVIRSSPLFSFLSSRIQLFWGLHKLYRNSTMTEQINFDKDFDEVSVLSIPNLEKIIANDPLWIEFYMKYKEKLNSYKEQGTQNMQTSIQNAQAATQIGQATQSAEIELNDKYTVSKVVTLIRHFDAHVLDLLKLLGQLPTNFEEVGHYIDHYFAFMLHLIIVKLHKMAASNPKIRGILQIYLNGS